LGRNDESLAALDEALRLSPEDYLVHSNYVMVYEHRHAGRPEAVFEAHREWARRHADPLKDQIRPHRNDRNPERRLRIGYVSAQFVANAGAYFWEPVLAGHDREQFEIYCYSNISRGDDVTARFQGYADHWRVVAGIPDAQLAD